MYPWLAHDVIGGHVGVLNNSEKVFWEFGAIIMLNARYVFLFFCTPTWPSDHVTVNQIISYHSHFSWTFLSKRERCNDHVKHHLVRQSQTTGTTCPTKYGRNVLRVWILKSDRRISIRQHYYICK